MTTLWGRYYYYHFTNEKLKAQKGYITWCRVTKLVRGRATTLPVTQGRNLLFSLTPLSTYYPSSIKSTSAMCLLPSSSKLSVSNDAKKSRTSPILALGVVIIASNPRLVFQTAFHTTDKHFNEVQIWLCDSYWRKGDILGGEIFKIDNTYSYKFLTSSGLSGIFFFPIAFEESC